MNDETKDELMKRTREWLQSCVNAATRSGVPEEADLEAFILAHLDGEPARLAAAREEQREADAKFCPNCLGVGFVERPVPCPYCDDSTHDHYCPTGTQRQQCGCGAERIRGTPLTATPLADELRTLRARVAELEECKQEGDDVSVAAQRLRFWEENPYACPVHFGARTACGQCYDSERALRLAAEAQVAEAHERLDEFGMRRDGERATLVEGIAAMRTRIDEYRVDWYRAEAQVAAARAMCEQIRSGEFAGDYGRSHAAGDVLRAMDEATKK